MSSPHQNGPVLWEVDPRGVASVVFNRPEVNNAYNGALIEGVLTALEVLSAEKGVRAVVLSGKGKHFQAGADLRWIREVRDQDATANLRVSRQTADAVRLLNIAPVPTVGLVQGGCFGGGTGIIAACDVVVAAENAVFSIAEVRWGLTAAIIIPQLNDAIGVRQVRRYALTGERFGAHDARRIGLVHEVVPLDELATAGERVIGHLLENGPTAIAETKALTLNGALATIQESTFEALIGAHAAKRRSDEGREGLASFAEKRPARWKDGS